MAGSFGNLFCLFVGIYTFAQAPAGTLAGPGSGRVVDATGAAILGARIVVTNKDSRGAFNLYMAANLSGCVSVTGGGPT
jgi:hypothetical protein